MKYGKLGTSLGAVTGVLAMAVSGGGLATIASAQPESGMLNTMQASPMPQRYRVDLRPLNNSGVHGAADLVLTGRELTVSVQASGMTPDQVHAQHIHGINSEDGAAECPTDAQDTNKDSFISVSEGAPTYGPIKLNLTNPQTPFGPNDTIVNGVKLFTPFAGMPAPTSFPKADANGNISFSNTYVFDTNDAAANAAFQTLNPLTNQEIVLHGAVAPKDVETAQGGGATTAYDGLLPVACARITAVSNDTGGGNTSSTLNNFDAAMTAATTTFQLNIAQDENNLQSVTGGSDALTAYFSANRTANENFQASLSAAENQYRSDSQGSMGSDQARNTFIDKFNHAKADYFNSLEQAKNMLSDNLNRDGQAVAKDQFMNSFNTSEAAYSNQLEQAKNSIH